MPPYRLATPAAGLRLGCSLLPPRFVPFALCLPAQMPADIDTTVEECWRRGALLPAYTHPRRLQNGLGSCICCRGWRTLPPYSDRGETPAGCSSSTFPDFPGQHRCMPDL